MANFKQAKKYRRMKTDRVRNKAQATLGASLRPKFKHKQRKLGGNESQRTTDGVKTTEKDPKAETGDSFNT